MVACRDFGAVGSELADFEFVAVVVAESFVGSDKVMDVAERGICLGLQALEHADPLVEAHLLLRLLISEF